MSFQDVRNALLFGYTDDLLSDKEFLIVHKYYQSENPA